jgi:hypothetical protein
LEKMGVNCFEPVRFLCFPCMERAAQFPLAAVHSQA